MAASLSSFDVAACVDRCRFATGCCETHCHGCMNVAWAMFWQHQRTTMKQHSNAICNQRFKNRIELRTQEQPLLAKHIGGTIRAQNDRSRNRRTDEVPFIAGCNHFTRKNTRFRAPASSTKHSPCNIHAAITMRFAAWCRFATGCCETHCHGCMNVAWAMFWGGSRSTKPCVFPCKVVAAGDERYLVCAAVAAAVVLCANCSSYVFCNEWLFLCA